MGRNDPSVLDDLLREEREFPPPPAFRDGAVVRDRGLHEAGTADPEAFWENEAKALHWFTPWSKVLEWNPPHARWFVGATTNITWNCLKDLGVRKGDRVAMYMPLLLETAVAMLACARIGALARPEEVLFTRDLPKTRSGKIMRRLLRDIADGRALGDVTTLADPAVVAALREDYEEKYGG